MNGHKISLRFPLSTFSLSLSSGFTSVAAFLLTREVWNARAGLLAACFIAIVPGYISRSVAGSYDNEGIAIFALLFTYFLWLKSIKTGSVFWATAAALSYFYMVFLQCSLLLLWVEFQARSKGLNSTPTPIGFTLGPSDHIKWV